eukprot:c27800_g1_i1 orf=511-2115(+)
MVKVDEAIMGSKEPEEGRPFLQQSITRIDEGRQTLARRLELSDDERAYEKSEKVDVSIYNSPVWTQDDDRPAPFSWKKLWLFTGPGFLMSIAYLDPGNLEGDLQAGAIGGYSLLWLLMVATIMGLIIQIIAARLGVATGRDLAALCREEYPVWATLLLWIMAEIAIIGADIQEVIGSAIALKILSNGVLPIWAGVLITGTDGLVFLLLENFGVRKLEAFFGLLITIMALSFAWMFGEAMPDATAMLRGLFVPYVMANAVRQAVAVVGAVIMPHNIFLHSALVQSRSIDISRRSQVREAVRYFTIESCIALFVSFLINVCVIAVSGKAFYGTDIADTIGLANAGQYLQGYYGNKGLPILYIWAIGLLAAGQSSTMTGTYAGQFVMAGFLNFRVKKWLRATVTRCVAIVPTVIIALIFDSSEKELDQLNEWLNVLQSIQLPFALIPLLCLVSRERIMGAFKLEPLLQCVSWLIALLVLAINGYLLVDFYRHNIINTIPVLSVLLVSATVYIIFVLYLVLHAVYGDQSKIVSKNTLC